MPSLNFGFDMKWKFLNKKDRFVKVCVPWSTDLRTFRPVAIKHGSGATIACISLIFIICVQLCQHTCSVFSVQVLELLRI